MKKAIIVVLVILVSAWSFLEADDFFKVKERILENYRWRFASLYITPALTLENMGYSSNIYMYEKQAEPDWTADIGIEIKLAKILAKRFIFIVNERPYYSFFAKNRDERAFNNLFRFNLHTYLGSFNLAYILEWDDIRTRPNSEFGTRIRHRNRNDTLSLDIGRHDALYINLYSGWRQLDYENDNNLPDYNVEGNLNRDEWKIGLKVNRMIFSRTLFFVNYEYFDYRFSSSSRRDGTGNLVSLGLIFPEDGRITGNLRLGYKFYQPRNPEFQDYSAPFGSGEVSVTLFRALRLRFNYLVDNFFTFYQPSQYFQERSLDTTVEYYLNRNLKIGYRYFYGILAYKNLIDGLEMRRDNVERWSVILGVKIFKTIGIGLEYANYRADSDQVDFVRSYHFIGGYITHEF